MIVGVTLALCSVAAGADTRAADTVTRTVTVSGEAELRVVPDEVVMTFGVETHDLELTTSRMQNDERVGRIFTALAAADIEKKHIVPDASSGWPGFDIGHTNIAFCQWF